MVALLGQRDELLKVVEAGFDTRIVVRGNEITISGKQTEVERVALLFEELVAILEQGQILSADAVGRTIDMIKEDAARPSQVLGDVLLTIRGRTLRPKTFGQKRYVDAIRSALEKFQPEAVMHFAASALVGESMQNPSKYFRNNKIGRAHV